MPRLLKGAASASTEPVPPVDESQGDPETHDRFDDEAFDSDAILAFRSETAPEVEPVAEMPRATVETLVPREKRISRRVSLVVGAAVALAVPVAAAIYVAVATHSMTGGAPAAPSVAATGTVVLDAHPAASVAIDGVPRGETPVTLALPPGNHTATLAVGGTTRSIPLTIEAGTTTRQDVEFAAEALAAAGRLDITSEPSGARVLVDGVARGQTPIALGDVPAGAHTIAILSGDTTVRRTVTVSAGATATIAVSIAAGEAAAGWLAISAPIELTVIEGGQVVGTTGAARMMLPVGAHNLTLSNSQLEFETTASVRIDAGKTTKSTIALPNGSLSVNALPWADVLVDGKAVGTTPLANLAIPIGSHELVLRNPQLGERRRTVTLAARTPTRIGVDFHQ